MASQEGSRKFGVLETGDEGAKMEEGGGGSGYSARGTCT